MARASAMPALDGKKPYRCWRDLRKPCGHGALSTKWKISSCSGGLDRRYSTRTSSLRRRPDVFIEPIHCPLPRHLGRGFIVARRRVVVETVLGAGIGVLFVVHPVRLQRGLECRPTRIDAFIHSCVVDQHVRLDLCDVGCRRLCAVEGNTGKKAITQPDRQRVHDTASKAEANGAESTVACRMPFDPVCGRHEVFGSLCAI